MSELILFYDIETIGLPLFKEPSEHPDQPHIVQLAAALVDSETRKTIQSIDLISCPDGWEISQEMTDIHGISNEFALKVGVEERNVMRIFLKLWCACDYRVAFNQSFDARIIRIAQHRFNPTEEKLDLWKNGKSECAMKMAQKHIGGKYPKLIDAYRYFLGCDFENAHSAMADVNACIAVYFAMKDLDLKASQA